MNASYESSSAKGGLDAVDAVFVGLTDRRTVVRVQRAIAEFDAEPLSAVIPGVTFRIHPTHQRLHINFRFNAPHEIRLTMKRPTLQS